jgi:hypothetical protein
VDLWWTFGGGKVMEKKALRSTKPRSDYVNMSLQVFETHLRDWKRDAYTHLVFDSETDPVEIGELDKEFRRALDARSNEGITATQMTPPIAT